MTGPLTAPSATINGGTIDNTVIGASTAAAVSMTSLNGGPLAGMRNLIINGEARVDQRFGHSGATQSASLSWLCDRWSLQSQVLNKLNLGSLPIQIPGIPHTYGLVLSTNTPYTLAAADYFLLIHRIEAQNVAHLQWGTANAKPVTLSFWAQVTLAGTYSAVVQNIDGTRTFPFTFNCPVANTAYYFTIPIPAITTGVWQAASPGGDNGQGIQLVFNLGCGTNSLSSTSGSWQTLTSPVFGVTGTVQLVTQPINTQLVITGVQLELGSVATPFERRSIGTELALCQRYYQKLGGTNQADVIIQGYQTAGGHISMTLSYPTMRAPPAATVVGTWNTTNASPNYVSSPGGLSSLAANATAVATGVVAWYSQDATTYISLNAEL
jgi:hypothetical protein